MIIEAQFWLLLDVSTVRTFLFMAPLAIRLSMTGVVAFLIPSGLNPSSPITITCSIPEGHFSEVLAQEVSTTSPIRSNNKLGLLMSILYLSHQTGLSSSSDRKSVV